jgi:hypothetical protein
MYTGHSGGELHYRSQLAANAPSSSGFRTDEVLGEPAQKGDTYMITNSAIVWPMIGILLCAPAPAAPVGPDGLAQAARLAAHAQTLEDECRWRESGEWLGQAVTALKRVQSPQADQNMAAGNLLATLTIRARDLKDRTALYRRAEQTITKLLHENRVQSADRLLRETAAPACVVSLTQLESVVASREAHSRELVREGNEAVRQHERKAALRAFDRAAAEDAEAPGLTPGRVTAQALAQGHPFRKTVVTLLVLGALSAGGYYGHQYEQKHNGQLALSSR